MPGPEVNVVTTISSNDSAKASSAQRRARAAVVSRVDERGELTAADGDAGCRLDAEPDERPARVEDRDAVRSSSTTLTGAAGGYPQARPATVPSPSVSDVGVVVGEQPHGFAPGRCAGRPTGRLRVGGQDCRCSASAVQNSSGRSIWGLCPASSATSR